MTSKILLQRAFDFIEAAESARDIASLQANLTKTLLAFGVSDYTLIAAAPRADNGARIPRRLTQAVDKLWSDRYQDQKYYNVDFGIHLALQQSEAFSWTDFEKKRLPDGARALFAECRDHLKIDGGFIVPTHDARGFTGLVAMFHEQGDLEPQMKKALKLIAIYGIERAKELHNLSPDEDGWDHACPLTPRQREVISFSAAGKTDWEISRIVGIAEKTVNHHFEAAKAVLKVHSRPQAVAIAIQRGWVSP